MCSLGGGGWRNYMRECALGLVAIAQSNSISCLKGRIVWKDISQITSRQGLIAYCFVVLLCLLFLRKYSKSSLEEGFRMECTYTLRYILDLLLETAVHLCILTCIANK